MALVSCLFDPLLERGYRPFLLTYPPYGQIFADDDRVTVLEVKREELFSTRTLRKLTGFDLYIDLHSNPKTWLLQLMLRGRWLRYSKDSLRRRLAVWIPSFRKPYSVVKAYLKTLGTEEGRPLVKISEERLKRMRSTLGEGFITVGVGARYCKKRYPYFDKIAEILSSMGYRVIFVGDNTDAQLVKGWKGENLCGKLSLPDVMAVIKLSSLFVGNDSGLLHLARCVGTKAIQIYGGTHPTLGFSLEPTEGRFIIQGLSCQPCDIHGKGSCKYGTYQCLDIEPEKVVEVITELLHESFQ
ncbi:glycosyltransferase family 9 protein [Thermocrinis albus]|uniref:glycosyltransferase family 9 protein n=1 Tax=Thermocrinis albus TaxID=136094 RepID=UPI001FE083A9|nr:glycosyltransferase family 9 protein [Thermocrinis albus]